MLRRTKAAVHGSRKLDGDVTFAVHIIPHRPEKINRTERLAGMRKRLLDESYKLSRGRILYIETVFPNKSKSVRAARPPAFVYFTESLSEPRDQAA